MEPLFFGTNKRLYGVLHTPPQGTCDRAILICPPVGQEYLRLHRSLVWLSQMFTQQGIGVLRFDYRGTGDSAGALEDVELDHWLEDGTEAIGELKEQFGNVELSVVGVRLGALIAVHCSSIQPVERLLLWEPCENGADYFAELRANIEQKPLPKRNFESAGGSIYHNGFVYPPKLQHSLEMARISNEEIANLLVKELFLLNRSSCRYSLADAQVNGLSVNQHICNVDFSWLDVDVIGSAIIPHEALDNIVSLIS